MAFELKVRGIGGGLWIQLPERVASQLAIADGDSVFLTDAAHGGYRLSASPGAGAGLLEQMNAAENVVRRYPTTLRELVR